MRSKIYQTVFICLFIGILSCSDNKKSTSRYLTNDQLDSIVVEGGIGELSIEDRARYDRKQDSLRETRKSRAPTPEEKLMMAENNLNSDISLIQSQISSYQVPIYNETQKILDQLNTFEKWSNLFPSSSAMEGHKKQKQELAQLKKKIQSIQIREFPKMRKAFAKLKGQELWRNDMTISIGGANSTVINISHHSFALNANIEDFNNSIFPTLTRLRFKQTRYRWYPESDKYTYYKLETKNDAEQ